MRTLVVGTGISAAAYIATINQDLGAEYIGGPYLWQGMPQDHTLDHPKNLLVGNLLGNSQDRKVNTPPQVSSDFLVKDFVNLVEAVLNQAKPFWAPDTTVVSITRVSDGYSVGLSIPEIGPVSISVDQVILANGTGPAYIPTVPGDSNQEINIPVESYKGHVIAANDFLSPQWSPPDNGKCEGKTVAIYGDSVITSWVAEQAHIRGMKVVLWFTRPGSGNEAWNANARFKEAFPPGSPNTKVQADFDNVRKVLSLQEVILNEDESIKIGLSLQNESGQTVGYAIDFLVYALGAGHAPNAGIPTILDEDIKSRLIPYYDKNLAISSTPALLAIGTEDKSLMIVGSALNSSAGFDLGTLKSTLKDLRRKKLQEQELPVSADDLAVEKTIDSIASYAQISDSLPLAARPAEGIALVMASIEALNDYMPVKGVDRSSHNEHLHVYSVDQGINFNTSNRTQLAVYLAAMRQELDPFTANLAVKLIVHLRTPAGNMFGLRDDQVERIIETAQQWVELSREQNGDFEKKRLEWEKQNGIDTYLDLCVNFLTTDDNWKQHWQKYGIQC